MESARQEFEAATRPQERSCTRERSETRPQGRAQDVRGSIRSHPRPWHLIFVEYDRHIEAGAEDARAGGAGAPEGRGPWMARVLFASNEAPRPREKRIFAFTTSYRADSVPRPYISLQDAPVEKQAWQR